MPIKLVAHRFDKQKISHFLKHSQSVSTDIFTLFFLKDSLQKYAFICPKKIGSAPIRNKIKRQFKESFLRFSTHIEPNYSIIIMAKKKIVDSTFKNIHDMLLLTLKKKNIINENS